MSGKNYDSGFCGSLPLNLINHVQEYGFLVITDPDLVIMQVSENIAAHTGIKPTEVTGRNLRDFFEEAAIQDFDKKSAASVTQRFSFNAGKIGTSSEQLAVVSVKQDLFIFEFENSTSAPSTFSEIYQRIRRTVQLIEQCKTYHEVLQTVVKELKSLSGFDKVMIYRFDDDWNGNVVAEEKEEGMDAYLGLYFPASDVPKQARELYYVNPYRLIPDKNYTPSRLYPLINPVTSAFVDLTTCNMRGVAKVHIEYLTNMKVTASMSARIIKDNKLWGLISCHHRKPYFLDYESCMVFEHVATLMSYRLSAMEIREATERNEKMRPVHSRIVEEIYAGNNLKEAVRNSFPFLMELLNCNGVAWVDESNIAMHGDCPDADDVEELVSWLQAMDYKNIYVTSHLEADYEGGVIISDKASGIIAFPVLPASREYIIGFRGEIPRYITWGGNPDEAIVFDSDKVNYHPRSSFQQYKQSVQNQSFPFNREEIGIANDLQRLFLESRLSEYNQA